ncbi:cupredoxin domain-containing protein [Solirhodobacter olei]|uniref:cupredoxin domain-containing protein n=1 Tax=Solirhodobacter olei TaxID=2493082 RepID=UPI000FDAB487|nr:cupredoxin domain-containing protein [Solirhodobacter olei]
MITHISKIAIAAGFAAATALGATAASAQSNTVTKTIYIYADQAGLPGADHKNHDAFFPADFVVKAGQQVKLVFINNDDAPHSFTAPGLHLNVVIKAGVDKAGSDQVTPTTTTYTFTPTKAGEYRWHCVMPCDTYSMNRQGYMAGYVKVI